MKTLRSHDEVSAESDLGLGEAMREELRGGKHWLIVQLLFYEAKNRLEEAKIAFAGELVPSFGHVPGEIPTEVHEDVMENRKEELSVATGDAGGVQGPRETDLLELGSERLKAARGPGHGTT